MRIRATFSKTGSLRFIGHLDLFQIWERTMRRAGLPLAYTQGFHPGPKIQIAAALPLGFIGLAEVVDLWINPEETYESILNSYMERLQANSPPGLKIMGIEVIEDRAPALQTRVTAAEYQVTLLDGPPKFNLGTKVKELLAKTSLRRERRGKPYDLRPLIQSLDHQEAGLRMILSARESATGRPEEVLAELGIPVEMTRIERIRLILLDAQE
jgi:radical SAM-linked protein